MPEELKLTDAELDALIVGMPALKFQAGPTVVHRLLSALAELLTLRRENAQLRGMVAGLAEAFAKVKRPFYCQTQDVAEALAEMVLIFETPTVRAVAEAARKEKEDGRQSG